MKNYLIAVMLFLVSISASAQYNSGGCGIISSSRPDEMYQLFQTSGNMTLDNFISTEVTVLRSFFGVQPSFYFYDDSQGMNALSIPIAETPLYPSGTIIFGEFLLRAEFANPRNVTSIPIIIAHEFGHILDYNTNATNGYPTPIKELFADFMAGCYLFHRSTTIPTNVQAALYNFYSKGNYDFTNPNFHGTPQQRLNAVISGFNWLQSTVASMPGQYISPLAAVQAARSYLGIR